MGVRLGIVQINVTDRDRAITFYRDTLGLPVRESNGPDGPFEIDLGEGPIVLVYAGGASPSSYENQRTTLAFHTDDLDGAITAWRERGVEFVPIPWSNDGTGTAVCPYGRFIAFRDPFGNTHELMQPRNDGSSH